MKPVIARVLICIAMIYIAVSNSTAEGAKENRLGIYAEMNFVTRSIHHGWDLANDKAAFTPFLLLDTPFPAVKFGLWGNVPFDRDDKANDEINVLLMGGYRFFRDELWSMKVYGFMDYIILPSETVMKVIDSRTNEIYLQAFRLNTGFSFPKLLAIGPSFLVPVYNFYHLRPLFETEFKMGVLHEIMLEYKLPLDIFVNFLEKQSISFNVNINYDDGVFGAGSGWSHTGINITCHIDICGIMIKPGAHYQWLLHKEQNREEESWFTTSVGYRF